MVTTNSLNPMLSMSRVASLNPDDAFVYQKAMPDLLGILAPIRKHLDVPFFVRWLDDSVSEVRATEVCGQEFFRQKLYLLRQPRSTTECYGFFQGYEVQWERPKQAIAKPGRFIQEFRNEGQVDGDKAWEYFPISWVFGGIQRVITKTRISADQRAASLRERELGVEAFLAGLRTA